MSTTAFFDAIKARRSIYALSKTIPISDSRIEEILKEAILHTPSSFNSQTTRLVVLLKDDHDKFWDITKAALKPLTPEDKYPDTVKKMDGFKAGYGSVLFYEDQEKVKGLEEKFAIYADRFQPWSEHTSAMHQLVLWTAFETEGLGANLQHYNPVVDEEVAKTWNVPKTWKLKAQLVFGGRAGEPKEKTFEPVEQRLKIYGNRASSSL